MMLNLARPRYFVPVHGEYRQQHMHAELARQSGIRDEDIFILENGDVLELDARQRRDRRQGARRAWCSSTASRSATPRASCCATASSSPATASSSPWSPSTRRAATRWRRRSSWRAASCTTTSASRRCSTSAATALDELMDELGAEHVTGQHLIREDINERLAELVFQRTKRRPLIMPVVVEV